MKNFCQSIAKPLYYLSIPFYYLLLLIPTVFIQFFGVINPLWHLALIIIVLIIPPMYKTVLGISLYIWATIDIYPFAFTYMKQAFYFFMGIFIILTILLGIYYYKKKMGIVDEKGIPVYKQHFSNQFKGLLILLAILVVLAALILLVMSSSGMY